MVATAAILREKMYSVAEYLELEAVATQKHEFLNGKIIPMPGASYRHNLIASNIITALNILLEEKIERYAVLPMDMKIHIPQYNHFVYPDAVVICEKPQFYDNRTDTILNPILIVEVLSQRTEEYDRGLKFTKYKTLPSFKEYVLVAQDMIEVTSSCLVGSRLWQDTSAESLDQNLYLPSLDVYLPLKRVYRNVDFEEYV